jgi:hypothetical protein
MNWGHYVELAKGLAGKQQEASKRSAVSRAYYGAFNLSRRWVEANVAPVSRSRAHQQVWETFKNADRATLDTSGKWELIGELGDSLRSLRNQADYDEEVPNLGSETGQAVESAELILALLVQLEVAD